MAVSPANLERYRDFVERHSTNGVYDPEKGLGGLLSTLTPDPKPVVLAGMQPEVLYFTGRQLYKDMGIWLENQGISRRIFPVTNVAAWEYCERVEDQEKIDGSLVEIGAVVKQSYWQSVWGELRTGYIKSQAGEELAVALLPYVCEFVSAAREYGERQKLLGQKPHQFDSMWRVLGVTGSKADNGRSGRSLAVFQAIEFLVNHPGVYRLRDILREMRRNDRAISDVLNKLGRAGVIDYDSPDRDIQGKRAGGWSVYRVIDLARLQDITALYQEIKASRDDVGYKNYLRLAEYIQANPTRDYERHALSGVLGLSEHKISTILSVLANTGVLGSAAGIRGQVIQTKATANDLTRMFYDGVLLPIKEVAATLTPPAYKPLDPKKLGMFLENYQEERSQNGPQGGKETRRQLVIFLTGSGPVKLSHLVEMYNEAQERQLSSASLFMQLQNLIKKGLVRQPAKGYYELV